MSPRILFPATLLVSLVAVLCTSGLALGEQFIVSAFGDSITTGYPYWTGTDGNGCLPSSCGGGYREPLQALLQSSGRNALVQNWGRRGDTTESGLARIDAVLTASKPRYLLLMEGTNQLYWGSAQTVRDNLGYMIDKAKARGVLPVLGTITPDPRYPEKNIPGLNSLLRDLAQEKKIALADQYAAVIDNWSNLCSSDQMHPNLEGYAIMGRVWAEAMQPDIGLTPIYMLLLYD